MPRSSYRASAWAALGQALIRRRLELGYQNRTDFTGRAVAAPDYQTVAAIEKARRTNFDAETLARCEVAYELRTGTITAFLSGAADTLAAKAAVSAGVDAAAVTGMSAGELRSAARALLKLADALGDDVPLAAG